MKLPFGLKDDRIVTVEETASGKACGALCPACLGPLVARKGEILVHHFAHDGYGRGPGGRSPCTRGDTAAIEQMAVQLVSEADDFPLPPLTVRRSRRSTLISERKASRDIVPAGTTLSITSVRHNQQIAPGVQPAILCELTGFGQLAIELSVNGVLGSDATEAYANLGLNCVEIDFSEILKPSANWLPTVDDVRKLLYSDETRRRWVFHRDLVQTERELATCLAEEVKELERKRRQNLKTTTYTGPRRPHSHTSYKPPHQPKTYKSDGKTLWAFCRSCYKPWQVDIIDGNRPNLVRCPLCKQDVMV